MRVLFITDKIPYPAVSGNLQRTYNLVKRFAREHEVWLAAPLASRQERSGVSHMQQFCHEVVTAMRHPRHPFQHFLGLLRYALQDKPWEYAFEHCEELFQEIRRLTATEVFDVVHIEPSYMGLYLDAISSNPATHTSLTFHNIESSLFSQLSRVEQSLAAKVRARLHSIALRRWEASYTGRFDRCITVSEEDRRLLHMVDPRLQIEVVPNGVDTEELQPLSEAPADPTLLFVGSMSYAACVDAITFFCREILPHVRQAVPNVELWIVGRDPAPEVRRLAEEKIHVSGWVESVQPYYRRSTVCIVPLRAGGGTRLKILEAMALGRPVVSTSIGCEGLAVVDGEHLMIADTPEKFAAKTIRLLSDITLRQDIAARARQLVVEQYDWNAIAGNLLRLYCSVVDSCAGATNGSAISRAPENMP